MSSSLSTSYGWFVCPWAPSVEETYEKTRDAEAAGKLIDDFMSVNMVTGEDGQKALMLKLQLYPPRTVENITKVQVLMDQVIAIDAQSETGKQAAAIKNRAEMIKKRLQSAPRPQAQPKPATE